MGNNNKDYTGPDRRTSTPVIMEKLDRIKESVDDTKEIAEDNRKALRGHNKVPGLVGDVKTNSDNIDKLEDKSNRNDLLVGFSTVVGTIAGVIFGKR